MKPAVTEEELENVLRDIVISKNKNKQQTRKILDEILERCIANEQNFPELYDKCLQKVLWSKEFGSISAKKALRRVKRGSTLNIALHMIREGKSEEEINKFLLSS